jgi:hypothetical protein
MDEKKKVTEQAILEKIAESLSKILDDTTAPAATRIDAAKTAISAIELNHRVSGTLPDYDSRLYG